MKKKRFFLAVLLFLVIIAAFTIGGYLWFGQEKHQKYTGPVEKITVAAYAGDTGALVYVAQEQRYFAENGLDVIIKDYEAGKLAADALLTGNADICTCADFVLVSNSFDNEILRTLATVAMANICEMVVRKDHGVETISDLKDKKIGVTRKSTGEFFLGTFLLFNGLSIRDVEIVDLKPSEMVEAISSGDIDAGFTWQPNAYHMKKRLGQTAVSWSGQSGQDFFFLLLTKEEWLKKHPSATERFLRALVQAEEYVRNNTEEAKNFAAEKFNCSSDYVDDIWPRHDFVVSLPQSLILMLEDQARWTVEHKLTEETEIPNYLNYVFTETLEKVKPGAVSIVR